MTRPRNSDFLLSSFVALTIGCGCLPAFADSDLASTSLQGKVTIIDVNNAVPAEIQRLTDTALEKNDTAQHVEKVLKKFNSKTHKAEVVAKEAAYAMVPYRGFGPSREGSQVLLEQTKKISCLAAAEFFKRKIEDDTHTKIVGNMLQIAMGLDEPDKERSQQMVHTGYEKLKKLVGESDAEKTLDTIKAWSRNLNVPPTAFLQTPWDVDEMQKKVDEATKVAVHGDPIMHQVVKKVRKYNRSKAMVAASGVIEGGTAVASLLAPGLLIPVGIEAVNATFIASTGGCEETKLVNEMYYGKAMESRFRRLKEETQLALTNYETAIRTKSPTLLACSEAILQGVVGTDRVEKFLGQSVLANGKEKQEVPLQTAERSMSLLTK